MENTFDHQYCSGRIIVKCKDDVVVNGVLKEWPAGGKLLYFAAAAPDFRTSYSGSALPFANQEQAFSNSPNKGSLQLTQDRQFTINIQLPNSFMIGLGSVTVPPTVFIKYVSEESGVERQIGIQISSSIPFRSLTYPLTGGCARRDATFYENHHCLPVRDNQEQILRQSGYPSDFKIPENFWGMKPAL